MFTLNRHLSVRIPEECDGKPVQYAAKALKRDLANVFEETDAAGGTLILQQAALPDEAYEVTVTRDAITVSASSQLGFAYGIYAVSREFLGVLPFWFFMDQPFARTAQKQIPEGTKLVNPTYAVKYRGWFVNDEVLLDHWSVDRDPAKPFALTYEALLRLGGNMVIPGTGENARKYRQMASDMGLVITQHHAEPLGAEMFLHAWPDLDPSYDKYPEKFQKLWQDAIDEQKGMKVLWNLGFRGQGDVPFWHNDPRYSTPESRGKLISDIIRLQYDMVRKSDPKADCCVNLYGEVLELYRQGCLSFPDDVIRIWADNGFGAMVSRRQDNHNPRIQLLHDLSNPFIRLRRIYKNIKAAAVQHSVQKRERLTGFLHHQDHRFSLTSDRRKSCSGSLRLIPQLLPAVMPVGILHRDLIRKRMHGFLKFFQNCMHISFLFIVLPTQPVL